MLSEGEEKEERFFEEHERIDVITHYTEWNLTYRDADGQERRFVFNNRLGRSDEKEHMEETMENYFSELVQQYYKQNFWDKTAAQISGYREEDSKLYFQRYKLFSTRDVPETSVMFEERLQYSLAEHIVFPKLDYHEVFADFPFILNIYLYVTYEADGEAERAAQRQETEAKLREMLDEIIRYTDGSLNAAVHVTMMDEGGYADGFSFAVLAGEYFSDGLGTQYEIALHENFFGPITIDKSQGNRGNNHKMSEEDNDMNEETKRIAEEFGCKYTAFEKGTDPALVEQAYKKAFEEGREKGFYPAILVLDEYAVEWLQEVVKEDYDRDEIIAACNDNGEALLKERFEEYTEALDEEELADFMGEETEGEVLDQFIGYCSFQDGTLEADTLLLELPVKNPWEIIAWLPMGGWNECPAAEEMISICKYWYEKYGAVPALFTHDVMEFYAPLRLNGVDSMEAAKEHYAFCNDRIDQGTRTYKVSELAAGLEESDVWYFWWD